jgi:hypothetical protein
MRSSGVLSATFFERVARKEQPGTSSSSFPAARLLLRTCCALLEDGSCRQCLVETLIEWRSLSAQRRASSQPSTDGAARHVRLTTTSSTVTADIQQNDRAHAPSHLNVLVCQGSLRSSPINDPTMLHTGC